MISNTAAVDGFIGARRPRWRITWIFPFGPFAGTKPPVLLIAGEKDGGLCGAGSR